MFKDQLYQDYLRQLAEARERMLNELLIGRAAAGDDGARSALDSVCRRLTGLPLDQVHRTSPESLQSLIHSGRQRFGSIVLAELLLQDVELSEKSRNVTQAVIGRLQAFCLLLESLQLLEPEEQAEYRKKLDVLAAQLEATNGDPYLHSKIELYRTKKELVQ